MKHSIIINWNNNNTYDNLIDILIKSQKMKYIYPNYNIGCKIVNHEDINREYIELLYSTYDFVITGNKKIINNYINLSDAKIINSEHIGLNEHYFDHDYEYFLLKQKIGPLVSNNFMFREYDICIDQRGGFNSNNKIIIFKKKYDPNLNLIKSLYNLQYINKNQISYYHVNKHHRYQPFDFSLQMFDLNNKIKLNYVESIFKLKEYHKKNSYYQKLFNRTKKILDVNQNTRLDLIENISQDDKDAIITQYIKCKKDSFVITIWKPAFHGIDKFIELLESYGVISYVKKISLTKTGLKNLMFWYYDEFNYIDTLKFVNQKLSYVESTEENNPVCIIIFENINKKKISGQKAEFKEFLRSKLLEFSGLDKTKYWGNDIMHVNDYFYQTIEYSQMLFNQNSINVLEKQNCEIFLTLDFSSSNLKLQTLRKILYTNISLAEFDRMITMGGCSLYAYGLRTFGDIDSVFIDIEHKSLHLEEFVDENFGSKSTKIKFMDSSVIGSSSWHESWTNKNKIITDSMKIDNFNDLVLDPKYFFYHQGVKFVTLEFEFLRKMNRNSITDHIDFMMINILYPELIKDYVILQNDQIENDNYFKIENDKYFMYNKKYKDIVGKYDDRFSDVKMKKIRARYSINQINYAKKQPIFNIFLS